MQNSQEQQAYSGDTEYEFVLLETDVLRPFREQAERENVPFDQLVNRYLADYGKETLPPTQQAAFAPPTQQATCDKPEKGILSMPLKELHHSRDEIVFIPAPGAPKLPPRLKHPRWTRFKRSLHLTRQEKWQVVANIAPLIGAILLLPFLRWITGN